MNYLLLKVDTVDTETSDKIIKSISGPLTALFKFKFVKNECQFFVQVIGRTPFLCHVTNISNYITVLYLTTNIESYFLLT